MSLSVSFRHKENQRNFRDNAQSGNKVILHVMLYRVAVMSGEALSKAAGL
jgi:hypothetical protein